MAHDHGGFAAGCPAGPSREGFRWGPSLPSFPRVTAAARASASPATWEQPVTTRNIHLGSQTCVAVSVAGDELSPEDLLGLLETAAAQVRASIQPRIRLAA